MHNLSVILLLFLSVTSLPLSGQASDTIRLCTYNVGYFDSTETERLDGLRLILGEIRPTVLAVQGLYADPSVKQASDYFRDSVLSYLPGEYQRFGFYASPDTAVLRRNMAIFFDVSSVRLHHVQGISRQVGYLSLQTLTGGDTILVFTVDWGIEGGRTSDSDRTRYAEFLHERLEVFSDSTIARWHSNVVVLGTVGARSSGDTAYNTLLHAPRYRYSRRLYDAAATPGSWDDNPDFSSLHTYNTRLDDTARGLRNRFDNILLSVEALDNLVPDSYHVFGNDGRHFGDSVNHGVNLDVSGEVADALRAVSPHLPVYIDLVFGSTSSVEDAPAPLNLDLSMAPTSTVQTDSVSRPIDPRE